MAQLDPEVDFPALQNRLAKTRAKILNARKGHQSGRRRSLRQKKMLTD